MIDNSHWDSGLPIVGKRFPGIRLTFNSENIGFARANNQAVRETSGRYLFFVNPDVVLQPETTKTLVDFLEANPHVGAVAPKVLNPDGTLQHSCRRFPTAWSGLFNRYSLLTRLFPNNRFSRDYLMTDFDHASTRQVDWLSGCCLMVSREAFMKVGMFDETYFLFIEDVDLCQTIGRSGYEVVYHPETQVTHRISSSNHRVPYKAIIKRHQGMSYYHHKFQKRNKVSQLLLDGLIALRCCSQLMLNVFR